MKRLFTYLLTTIMAESLFMASAQEGKIPEPGIIPEAPRAWQFRQVTMPVPSLSTGAATFDIPIYEIEVDGFTLPVALRYQAGGIKVDEDYQPIGYGWSLTPPLRITRQIYGRPDGLFPFVGETTESGYFEDYTNCRQCMLKQQNSVKHTANRNDSEHDLFTVHLADKSFGMIFDNGRFVTANNEEYRIETNSEITYINVTDPHGNVYYFSQQASITGGGYNSEWLPTSIKTLSGKVINISWRKTTRGTKWHASCPVVHMAATSGGPVDGEELEFYSTEALSDIHGLYDLDKINFGDGKMQFTYNNAGMLENVAVTNSTGQKVKNIVLTHNPTRFLSGVSIDGDSKYSFSYYENKSGSELDQDWWGYPNGAGNSSSSLSPGGKTLSPSIVLFSGADRSVNANYTADGMLKKAIFPTGAITEWEYELHKFSPRQSDMTFNGLRLEEPQIFSEGGGVRVKRMKLYNGADDTAPITRTYVYGPDGNGLANCIALPFLHTFVTMSMSKGFYDSGTYSEYLATISRQSDYMSYRPGEIPIWYSQVKEIEGEGYTIYNFEKLWQNNSLTRDDHGPVPARIFTFFSSGIVEKSREIYDASGRKLSSVNKEYRVTGIGAGKRWNSVAITRECIQSSNGEIAPDFDEQGFVYHSIFNGMTIDLAYIQCDPRNYNAHSYSILPYVEQLVSETSVEHTSTGDISRTISYEYETSTGLLKQQTISCGGQSMFSTYAYTPTSQSIASQMKAANAVGIVTGGTSGFGSAVSSYSYDMQRYGSTFKPRRVWRSRGTNPTWSTTEYSWNNDGTLASRTGADNISTQWTWDNAGRYPLSSTVGGILTNRAEWKPLVGVTAIISPDSIRQEFDYDTAGRLVSVKHSGRLLESYVYKINQLGNNYILSRKYATDTKSTESYSRFDALGRLWSTFSVLPSGTVASLTDFDAMGRPEWSWSAVPVDSHLSTAGEIISAAEDYYGDSEPYTELKYEASPRGRVVYSTKAGCIRHGDEQGVKTEVFANNASDYACTRYTISDGGITSSGLWPSGTLTVTVTTDEDGIKLEKFNDMRDLTVCERRAGHSTYYVYDDYGDLRYILPPGLSGTHSRSGQLMQDLAFWYDYDSRGRCILSKEPGRRAARMRYDAADRLVAEQSFNHPSNQWRLYFYDKCGRQVLAIDCAMSESDASSFAASVRCASPAGAPGAFNAYSVNPAPSLNGAKVVWAKYYDNYDFIAALSLDSALSFRNPQVADLIKPGTLLKIQSPARPGKSLGKLTGQYTGAGYESFYYDSKGMELQRCATSSGFNRGRRTSEYTYDLKPAKLTFDYGESKILNKREIVFSYDNAGREVKRKIINYAPKPVLDESLIDTSAILDPGLIKPLALELNYDNKLRIDSAVVLTAYDRAGRPASFTMGGNTRTISFDCNGWPRYFITKKASTVLLTDSLMYGESGRIISRQWNGNRYAYSYTPEGFLHKAIYSGPGTADYTAEYEYDERGNILWLERHGLNDLTPSGDFMFGVADEITATLSGNKPTSLRVRSDAADFSRKTGFGRNIDAELTYDECGRLYSDESRGIVSIEYDNNGYPKRTVFASGAVHTDLYDSFGNHISTAYQRGGIAAGSRRYTGDGHVIRGGEKDTLEMARFPGGFFDKANRPYYYVNDYRGSVSAVMKNDGRIEHSYDYYPYGELWVEPQMQIRPNVPSNKAVNQYTFGDKERLTADGIHEYDQSARRYAPAYPFFTSPDPFAGKTPWLSPYSFCGANPINASDPTGCLIYNGNDLYYKDSKQLSTIKDPETNTYVVYEIGFVFASDRTPIPVSRRLPADKCPEQYQQDENHKENNGTIDDDSNCHGYTFLDGQYWINDDSSLNTILSEFEEVSNVSESMPGDVVMFENLRTDENSYDHGTGEYTKVHSSTIFSKNGDGTVTMDGKNFNKSPQKESFFSERRSYSKTTIFRRTIKNRQLEKGENKMLEKIAKKHDKKH